MPYFYQKRAEKVITSTFDDFSSKYSVNVISNNSFSGNDLCIDIYLLNSKNQSPYSDISFYISKDSTLILPQIKGFEFEEPLTESLELIASKVPNVSLNKSSARSTYPFNSEYLIAQNVTPVEEFPIYQKY